MSLPSSRVTVGLLALALLAAPASAAEIGCAYADPPEGLLPADAERFSELVQSRAAALAEALRAEDAGERATVSDLLTAEWVPVEADALVGDWGCRVIKMGGLLPIVVYGSFDCRVARDGESLAIDKLTGSQRFSGRLTPSGDGYAYVGAGHVVDEAPRDYGASAEQDEVGCLAALGPDRLLLELPHPRLESHHNLLEMVRRR